MTCAAAATLASAYNTICTTSTTGRCGSTCAFSRSPCGTFSRAATRIEFAVTDIVEGPAALPGAAPSAVPPAALPGAPRPLVVAGWLLATSLTLCVLGYLALGVQGSWFTSAPALHWTPDAMAVSRGTASLGPE